MGSSTRIERRVVPRHRSNADAKLYFEPGNRTVECVIINISECGARVALKAPATLSDQLDLATPSGRLRKALVRWRIGLEAGLQFID